MFAEAYSEFSQGSKMERFAQIVYGFFVVNYFRKTSILDVLQGSEYDSDLQSILFELRNFFHRPNMQSFRVFTNLYDSINPLHSNVSFLYPLFSVGIEMGHWGEEDLLPSILHGKH